MGFARECLGSLLHVLHSHLLSGKPIQSLVTAFKSPADGGGSLSSQWSCWLLAHSKALIRAAGRAKETSLVPALHHAFPLQTLHCSASPSITACALCHEFVSALGVPLLAQTLKETTRSTQGDGKAPFGPWFWRRGSRRWGAHPQQDTGEMPAHTSGPSPDDSNVKVYFAQVFWHGWVIPLLFLGTEVGLSGG